MNTPETESIQKLRQEMRLAAIVRRDAIPAEERAAASRVIVAKLNDNLTASHATSIHCYISFRTEVETRAFIESVLASGMRVIVPVVEKLDDSDFLIHTEIRGLSALRRGAFGLDEPVERSVASLDSLDAVVVPLVAFDRHGGRLGYGKGFYDTFLHELPRSIPRIGLAFAVQEVPEIPLLAHDERLDMVLTEKEIIECRKPNV